MRLMEETLPPELQLFNRLMDAEEDAEIERLLQENRDLVTEQLVQYMEKAETDMRQEEGMVETAEHLATVLEKMKGMVTPGG